MRYRLKDLSADAIQIPPGAGKVTVNGEPVPSCGYIVVMRDRVWVFTREEFQDEFEADGSMFQVKDLAGNGAKPQKSLRKPRTAVKEPKPLLPRPKRSQPAPVPQVPPVQYKPVRKRPGQTLAEIIGPLLRKQAMTLDALTEAVKLEMPSTNRNSIYQTLWINRARLGWFFDQERAVWRFPANKGTTA